MTSGSARADPGSTRQEAPRDVGVWIVLGVALLTRLPHFDHPAIYDEYYTSLAVGTLLEEGSLAGESFTYQRAFLFSWMVAALSWLLGESFVALRLVSLASGLALPLLVYLCGRALAGRVAGCVAALLLCLDPNAIYFSQLARPYSLHALLFFVATLALFRAIQPGAAWIRGLWLAVALGGFRFAHHLSYLTAIGLAALAVCAAVDLGPTAWRTLAVRRRRHWGALGGLAVALLLVWFAIERGEWALGLYREAPSYLLADRSNFAYYARYLGGHLPVLCVALPLAWLAALQHQRRFALFSAVFLVAAFAMHSGAGRKLARYVLYLMPWFYLLLGVGAVAAWKPLLGLVQRGIAALSPRSMALRPGSWVTASVAVALALAAIFANPAYRSSVSMLAAERNDWPGEAYHHPPSDWGAAQARIGELAEQTCVLVASSGIKALHHLRRLEFDLSVTVREEADFDAEFAPDPRHGRPLISEPDSIRQIAAEHPSGLVVVDEVHWRRVGFVPDAVADLIESRFERVALPEEWGLLAFTWGDSHARSECWPDEPATL